MAEQDPISGSDRIKRLEALLAGARELKTRTVESAGEAGPQFSDSLSLMTLTDHIGDLQQQLRQAREELSRELIDFRLFSGTLDGSIPLDLASSVLGSLGKAISHAAHYLRHGQDAARAISPQIERDLDLRLSGIAYGSTRLLVSGSIAPDLAGESILDETLEDIFQVLRVTELEELRDLVPIVGTKSIRDLSSMLGTLEAESIGASLSWSASNGDRREWGGSLEAVRSTRERLAYASELDPVRMTIEGVVAALSDRGSLQLRQNEDHRLVRISYSKDQYHRVQRLHLGMAVALQVMKFGFIDSVTGEERAKYRLIAGEGDLLV